METLVVHQRIPWLGKGLRPGLPGDSVAPGLLGQPRARLRWPAMAVTARVRRPRSSLPPTAGDRFPDLVLPAASGEQRGALHRTAPQGFGAKWLLLLYWPRDFRASNGLAALRRHRLATGDHVRVLGVTSADQEVGASPFPILADARRQLAQALGLPWGRSVRATYLVDPAGIIRWTSLENLPGPRPLEAALRTLDAAPCPQPSAEGRRLECMCAWCRQVQAEDGQWSSVEAFIEARLPVQFTHGICPACLEEQEQSARERPARLGPEARRSARVLLRFQVLLDTDGGAHPAETVVVNRHGALVLSPVPHPEEAKLVLANLESGESAPCRVAWNGGESAPGQHKLGLELLEPRPAFWGPEYEAKRSEA